MKPHDCENLNDLLCCHADRFSEPRDLWQNRNIGEASCFKLARGAAQKRFPLEGEEVAPMDAYIESRFGVPQAAREQGGVPAPVMVLS